MKSFRRQSSTSSAASARSGSSSSSSAGRRDDGSADTSGRPLSRWLSKTNSLLEQITNAPGARGGEWEEDEIRAQEEAKRVSCPNCEVAFADKSALKQHYVLFPGHNPQWTGKGPDFPASPSSSSSSSFSSDARSRTSSRASSGAPRLFNTKFEDEDDDSPASDDDDRPDSSPLNSEQKRFASQFSKLHPTFYERDIVVRQDNSDVKDGGPVAKIFIGPGYGMTWNQHKHGRTASLSNPVAKPTTLGEPSGPPASKPAPGQHTRSYSVDVASTSHNLIGFDDDFLGHQGAVKRTPLDRSATEPAIHFESIEEHDEHHLSDEDRLSDDDHLHRPSTPSRDRRRRDSFESDDTYLATPARQTTGFAPQEDDFSDDHHSEPAHQADPEPHTSEHEDLPAEAETSESVNRHELTSDKVEDGAEAVTDGSNAFDAAFDEAFGRESSSTPVPEAPTQASDQGKPSVQPSRASSGEGTRKPSTRPAAPAPPVSTARSSLAARPAPPPPPPAAASSSLSSRKPPAPPPGPPPANRLPAAAPSTLQASDVSPSSAASYVDSAATGSAVQHAENASAAPAQAQKKKRAPPPPPPPRRGGASTRISAT
ncbi:hypothetical protein OC846_004826 [Tilletia horrida]|uniref:C2H2-type domain-containing protein n=1 Tax=Tilletia horrida TaxID=155126 RepID=A0AAN6JQT3_9BASI|nr:hypothetical protein OC845_004954 [Tilletia horrida]KAK0547520.1 hypothetical protein OC846_004826 [Tilletia horrida]KAK0562988.1 hypothetical protein OC861_005033 [Tilletia horrida]